MNRLPPTLIESKLVDTFRNFLTCSPDVPSHSSWFPPRSWVDLGCPLTILHSFPSILAVPGIFVAFPCFFTGVFVASCRHPGIHHPCHATRPRCLGRSLELAPISGPPKLRPLEQTLMALLGPGSRGGLQRAPSAMLCKCHRHDGDEQELQGERSYRTGKSPGKTVGNGKS